MPTEEAMRAVVRAYVDNYNAANLEGIVALFAPDAQVEDPVGTQAKAGHAEIRAFFAVGIEAGAKLHLDGPIRAVANFAAFAFNVTLEWGGEQIRFDVIDIFEFDKSGRIARMRAFFGAGNRTIGAGD